MRLQQREVHIQALTEEARALSLQEADAQAEGGGPKIHKSMSEPWSPMSSKSPMSPTLRLAALSKPRTVKEKVNALYSHLNIVATETVTWTFSMFVHPLGYPGW